MSWVDAVRAMAGQVPQMLLLEDPCEGDVTIAIAPDNSVSFFVYAKRDDVKPADHLRIRALDGPGYALDVLDQRAQLIARWLVITGNPQTQGRPRLLVQPSCGVRVTASPACVTPAAYVEFEYVRRGDQSIGFQTSTNLWPLLEVDIADRAETFVQAATHYAQCLLAPETCVVDPLGPINLWLGRQQAHRQAEFAETVAQEMASFLDQGRPVAQRLQLTDDPQVVFDRFSAAWAEYHANRTSYYASYAACQAFDRDADECLLPANN